jgi:hypothetical protein
MIPDGGGQFQHAQKDRKGASSNETSGDSFHFANVHRHFVQPSSNASDDAATEDLACLAYVSNALDPIICLKCSNTFRLGAAGDLRYDPIF